MVTKRFILPIALGLLAVGCAVINPQQGFSEVSANIKQRLGVHVHWDTGGVEDVQVKESVSKMLAQPLTAKSATQIALLNNQSLQAKYADLGISQAELAQAGLLKNPVLELTRLKPRESGESGGALDIELRFAFLDILLIPLRKKVAAEQYEATKQQIITSILDHAAATRKAFYAVQTAQQIESVFEEFRASAAAALETATRLHRIGNINKGAFDSFQLQDNEADLALAEAQMATRISREKLDQLMGTTSDQTRWVIEGGLNPLPIKAIELADIERRTVDSNLDLAMLRHNIQAIADQAGVENIGSIINDLELGYAWDREDSGHWKDGPIVEFKVPVFDPGFARRARAKAQIQQIMTTYTAKKTSIRSNARLLVDRLRFSREMVERYVDTILPLNRRIKDFALLNYNAMQIDVFRLLRAHEKQIDGYQRFVNALSDYWMARADLETLLAGRSAVMVNMTSPAAIDMADADEGGH